MISIRFDATRKHEIMAAQNSWAHELPRQAGQIGGPTTTWIEGPPTGNMVNFIVAPDFVAYLRKTGIPFQEV